MTVTTTKPATGEGATPSLIHMLHARYEAAMTEYNAVETHQPREPKGGDDPNFKEYYRCEHGLKANASEVDNLRRTILWQVPDTDAELTLLAYHLWIAHDLTDPMADDDKEAVAAAMTSVFDYLVSEGRIDIDGPGEQFRKDAMLAFNSRRYRTGQVEEA